MGSNQEVMSWIVLVENYGMVKEPTAYGIFETKKEAETHIKYTYVSPDIDTKIKTIFLNDFRNIFP